jgi:uncharacterized protein YggE
MRKKLWLILPIALLLIIVGLTGCKTTGTPGNITGSIFNTQTTGIWVSGEGKATAVPDVAVLSLGVQAQASTVGQAQSQASASMNAVVAALKAGGVADKDIQTQYFNIQQLTQYDNKTQQQIIIGYSVTNAVTAKVRTLANTGTIIDAVAQAGGDNTRINSISLTVNDPTPFQKTARDLAMADAKAKAKQLADSSGVKLGAPVYINEYSGAAVPLPQTISNGGVVVPSAAPTPISAGTTDITVDVQVTYSID